MGSGSAGETYGSQGGSELLPNYELYLDELLITTTEAVHRKRAILHSMRLSCEMLAMTFLSLEVRGIPAQPTYVLVRDEYDNSTIQYTVDWSEIDNGRFEIQNGNLVITQNNYGSSWEDNSKSIFRYEIDGDGGSLSLSDFEFMGTFSTANHYFKNNVHFLPDGSHVYQIDTTAVSDDFLPS